MKLNSNLKEYLMTIGEGLIALIFCLSIFQCEDNTKYVVETEIVYVDTTLYGMPVSVASGASWGYNYDTGNGELGVYCWGKFVNEGHDTLHIPMASFQLSYNDDMSTTEEKTTSQLYTEFQDGELMDYLPPGVPGRALVWFYPEEYSNFFWSVKLSWNESDK